jgi:glutamate-ammonia-ligase adenylyltransferase
MMINSAERDRWTRVADETPDPKGTLLAAERIWSSLDPEPRDRFLKDSEALRRLAWLLCASPGLVPFLIRHLDLIINLFLKGGLETFNLSNHNGEEREVFLLDCKGQKDIKSLARRIAQFRNAHLVRLYSLEIQGLLPSPDIWRQWSEVASCCLQGALDGSRGLLSDRGRCAHLAIVGMGKLGGGELNFASDIDLIYLYRPGKGIDPGKAHELAVQWATKINAVFEQATEEGPLFRVDLGLRPGGKDGELALTLGTAELYYQTQSAPWERWALIRAHPVAGDEVLGKAFVEMVRPIVFRKYLDYGVLDDIRALKERIQREIRWAKPYPLDVKMGRGGIREVEFFIQTLLIIYGGKLPNLRALDSLGTLEALVTEGLFPSNEDKTLREAYLFLRGVEHRIQMVYQRQTHKLPTDERDMKRIAGLMGYSGKEGSRAFMEDLQVHMDRVHEAFEGLLRTPQDEEEKGVNPRVEEILVHLERDDELLISLQKVGFHDLKTVRESIRRILGENFTANRSPRARQRLHRLFPNLLNRVIDTPVQDQTLFRLERFLEAVGPRGGYYALLEENPETLGHLISLFSQSSLLSRWLETHLESVDVLIDRGHHRPRRQKAELLKEVEGRLLALTDPEERLGRLREIRAQEVLRIGTAELWGELSPEEVGEELSNLAEVFLEATLQEALSSSGHNPRDQNFPLCVLGLGTFGGQELSYRSDLDLIFLFQEGEGGSASKGQSPAEHFTRIGQRVLSWATMPMKEGPGWPVDVRLRPSGRVGPLTVSTESFLRYHQEHARTWERQSLLKARFCAGDQKTGIEAMEMIYNLLSQGDAPNPMEFHDMRMRIERERGSKTPPGGVHLKFGPGGMADIEFLVQFYQLTRWADDQKVRKPKTTEALQGLTEARVFSENEGRLLEDSHRFFKGIENRLGLILDYKGTDQFCTVEDLKALEPLEGVPWIPSSLREEGIPEILNGIMAEVRNIYLRHLSCPSGSTD